MPTQLNELGFSTLAGAPQSPAELLDEVAQAEDLGLGVDGVIMHGATPAELAPVVEAYRGLRPSGRFDALDPNPGR